MTCYNYLSRPGKSFTKPARLDFLHPDGAIFFAVSSDSRDPLAKSLHQEVTLNVALNNGRRRATLEYTTDYDAKSMSPGTDSRMNAKI